MHKRRLLKLADLLEADAKNEQGVKFDLGSWGRVSNTEQVVSCGTAACAAGLAAISGAFKKDGLGYRIDPYEFMDGTRSIEITLNGECESNNKYDGSFLNSKKFFGLSVAEAEFIFTPNAYEATPRRSEGEILVAKRIRDFVAGKVAP